ncbi:MAG: hypothetical protein ACK5JT_11520 [Hyphomicrobiaceae bacterium]
MNATDEITPLWSQDQAIAYEAALEAINDVIAGYSEQIEAEESNPRPNEARLALLTMQTSHAAQIRDALDVTDDVSVRQVLQEFCAIVRARDAGESTALAARRIGL